VLQGRKADLTDPLLAHHALVCRRGNHGIRAHEAAQAHMITYINNHTSCRATREPPIIRGDGKRGDVRIVSFDSETPDTIVDVSHACPTGNLTMPSVAVNATAVDFRGNHVSKGDIPLYAASLREAEKEGKYGDLVRNMGCTFTPFVAETTGGLGPKARKVLRLISRFAHSRPAARALRFLEEQACIRATAYARQVEETALALRCDRRGAPAVDLSLPEEREASRALHPRRILLSDYLV
jgi:hypothetical protein